MKIFIQTLTLIVVVLFSFMQVNSVYKFVKITDGKTYFLKYKNLQPQLLEKIKNGDITFSLKDNHVRTEFYCGEFGCFFVNTSGQSIKDKGTLIIQSNSDTESIRIPYEISFVRKSIQIKEKTSETNQGLDISDSIRIKSIQQRALSCEISATADIISHLSQKDITENTLLKKIDKSQFASLPYMYNNKLYWGNPQEGFVGYINKTSSGETARQRKMTGYGVLEKPIVKLFHQYGFNTKVITQKNYLPSFSKSQHLTLVLRELKKGNMVQLWGDICTNPDYFDGKENPCWYNGQPSWDDDRKLFWYYKDADGKEVKHVGLNGEHAYYLLGYKGNIVNPTHIIVWDTYTGKHIYPTVEWMRKWKKMQYRSIIVYKK